MEFYLVKERKLSFYEARTSERDPKYTERSCDVDAKPELFRKKPHPQTRRDFKILKDLLANKTIDGLTTLESSTTTEVPTNDQNDPEKLAQFLDITIGMHSDKAGRRFVKICDYCDPKYPEYKGNILEKLKTISKTYDFSIRVHFSMSNYTCTIPDTNHTKPDLSIYKCNATGDIKDVSVNSKGKEGLELSFLSESPSNFWTSRDVYKSHTAEITIYCVAYPRKPVSIFCPQEDSNVHKIFNRKLLEDEIKTNVAIRAKDSTTLIKCHQSFLSAHIDVLEKNFRGDFEESKTKVIEMSDMTLKGVQAFLAYLYYFDTAKIFATPEIALEVFQASHKYNVTQLENHIKKRLLCKPDNWFNVDAALALFLFARNLENEEDLKIRAVKLIKMNCATLKRSSKYRELMEDNREAVMELFEIVCML